jgi:DNA-binding MarR family transcriptional regulator
LKEVCSGLAAKAGIRCPPESVWVLCRVAGVGSLPRSALSGKAGVTSEEGGPFVDRLVAEGLVAEADGHLMITDAGRAVAERLYESMRQTLVQLLEGWSPEDYPDLVDLLASLSRESMCDEVDLLMRESAPSAVK